MFCEDSSQLVLKILSHRGMNPAESDVHVGIDGGQNMLKLWVTITDRSDTEVTGRSLYSHVSSFFKIIVY